MKLITSVVILILFVTLSSFYFSADKPTKKSSVDKIATQYLIDFETFKNEVSVLANIADTIKSKESLPLLQNQITETRYAYKRVEYLFDYNYTKFSSLYINGGPVYKIYDESAGDFVIPPNGLQALDETIFSDEASEQYEDIKMLAFDLKMKVDEIAKTQHQNIITDLQIIEALRSGMVRVFTLGLTGFDTPGSANAINEALVSMDAMNEAFKGFGEDMKPRAKRKYKATKKLFKKSKKLLKKNPDFDTFDRMTYLKEVINPLYKSMLEFQLLNGIKTDQFKANANNYISTNLFEEEFLDTDHYSEFSFLPLNNPKTIELGKMLFFDPILSKNIDMSCATCHDPNKGFADGLPKSRSNQDGVFTKRNSPTVIDAGYSSRYFWDMREHNLERQVAHVVNEPLEFNIGFKEIAKRLYQSPEYVALFEESYGGIAKNVIYTRTISNAIAAYVNSLKSFNSEFDQYVRNERDEISQDIINGFNLFMGKAACGTCHFAPAFNGQVPPFYLEAESEVLGVTVGLDTLNPKLDTDPGRFENGFNKEEHQPHLKNSFKTVSIRNSGLTAPYMHNGSFETLEEVLTFYNLGGGAGMGIEVENQTLADAPLGLSEKETQDIITFLHALTDTSGLTNQNVKLPTFENQPYWNQRTY